MFQMWTSASYHIELQTVMFPQTASMCMSPMNAIVSHVPLACCCQDMQSMQLADAVMLHCELLKYPAAAKLTFLAVYEPQAHGEEGRKMPRWRHQQLVSRGQRSQRPCWQEVAQGDSKSVADWSAKVWQIPRKPAHLQTALHQSIQRMP